MQQRFRAGRLTTGFIAEEFPEGFRADAMPDAEANSPCWPRSRRPCGLVRRRPAASGCAGRLRQAHSGADYARSGWCKHRVTDSVRRVDGCRTGLARPSHSAWTCRSPAASLVTVATDWRPRRRRSGLAWSASEPVSAQVRPCAERQPRMAWQGPVGAERRVMLTHASGGTRPADAGQAAAGYVEACCSARCRAWSSPSASIAGAGGQGRRNAGRSRGDEDGERAARGPRPDRWRRSTPRPGESLAVDAVIMEFA